MRDHFFPLIPWWFEHALDIHPPEQLWTFLEEKSCTCTSTAAENDKLHAKFVGKSHPLHQNSYSEEKLGNVPLLLGIGYWVECATGGEPHDHPSSEVLFATHYHPVSKKAVEDVAKVPWGVKARFLLLMAEIRDKHHLKSIKSCK